MLIQQNIRDSFERLSLKEFIALGIFAYAYGSVISENNIITILRRLDKSLYSNAENNICKSLMEKGFVSKADGYFWRPDTVYALEPRYLFDIILYLMSEGSDLLGKIQKQCDREFGLCRNGLIWRIAEAVLNKDNGYLYMMQSIKSWGANRISAKAELVRDLIPCKDAWGVFIAFSPGAFFKTIEYLLVEDFELEHQSYNLDTLNELGDFYGKHAVFDMDRYHDMISCFRFLEYGEMSSFGKSINSEYRDAVLAIKASYKGEYTTAYKLFDKALKSHNKDATIKNVFVLPILDFFYMLNLAKVGDDAAKTKAKAFIEKLRTNPGVDLVSSEIVAKYIVLNSEAAEFTPISKFMETRYFTAYATNTLQLTKLLCEYFELDVPSDVTKGLGKFTQSAWAVVRHEMSCPGNSLCDIYGGDPLLFSIKRKKQWEIALDDIMDYINKEDNSGTKEADARIIYVIDHNDDLTIEEQKKLKSGAWGTPRPVSTSSFYTGEKDSMDDIDKEINKNLNVYHLHRIEQAARYLVGSENKVFRRGSNKNDLTPVSIVRNKLFLTINKNNRNGSFSVSSNLSNLGITDSGLALVKRDSNLYEMFDVSELELRILKTIVRVGTFPQETESVLKQLIGKLGNHVEIHSSLIDGGSTLENLDGSSTLSLIVTPSGDFYKVVIVARPAPEGKLKPIPGHGSKIIFDTIADQRYQVTRDLNAEKANYDRIYEFICDKIGSEENDNDLDENVFLLSVEGLLDILGFVQTYPDDYVIEWLEGQRIKVRKKLHSGAISANLRKRGNWFEIEGNINLDENTILSVQELLRLYEDGSRGKYIKLSDSEYVELEESLRKQLKCLNDLSAGKDYHIPVYHVGSLASIVHGDNGILKADNEFEKIEKSIAKAAKMDPQIPDTLQADLRDYQKEGFKWIVRLSEWGAGACLADDMGLGKTIQSIAFLLYRAKEGASLVVAPASVILNWAAELSRFAPSLNVTILNEADSRKDVIESSGPGDVVLCSYAILVREEETITAHDWNVICLDEAHTIKNRGTKMSSAAMKLKSKARLILTGTPLQNTVMELWNLFQFLNPGLLGSSEQFSEKYISGEHAGANAKRLKQAIKPFILRRRKSDVIEELPDKTDIQRSITLAADEIVSYETMRQKAEEELKNASKVDINALALITRLRQAACSMSIVNNLWAGSTSKTDTAVELINQIVEGGNRVLVFSQFTTYLNMVKETLGMKGVLYLDGSTPIRKREEMVKKFQSGEGKVFFISLKAGGLGLNLTGANYVIHLDPWWNPAIEQQATDRAYRIGQSRNVTVYHLISANTIEEKILRLHKAKKDMADALLEGTDIAGAITLEELKALVSG